jgi:biotin synthase
MTFDPNTYSLWKEKALANQEFTREECGDILSNPEVDILQLASAAGAVRMQHFGRKVKIHQINNVQNGLCPEDCGYCGQSKDSDLPVNKYGLKPADEIIEDAKRAKEKGIYRYCMVSSGTGPNDKRVDEFAGIIKRINDEVGIRTCLSAGFVNYDQAVKLKEAGLDRLNHNLNTSEANTPKIVTTHTYEDRMETLRNSRKAGLENCSGMIAGLGETDDDVIDIALEVRKQNIPSIPVNFLVPIEGNRLFDFDQLTPDRCLRILCLMRFLNPSAELRMGGGREGHLRGLQSLALYPANSVFVEGYLVTRGDKRNKVFRMVADAGFEIENEELLTASSSEEETSADKFQIDGNDNILHPKTAKFAGSSCSEGTSCG